MQERDIRAAVAQVKQTALSNDCLNPILDSNTIDNVVGVGNCGGTVSQQDESGQAGTTTTSQTTNPTIELQRATTTPSTSLEEVEFCEECFTNFLTLIEQVEFEGVLRSVNPIFGHSPNSIEDACRILHEIANENPNALRSNLVVVGKLLKATSEVGDGIEESTIQEILDCLRDFFDAGG